MSTPANSAPQIPSVDVDNIIERLLEVRGSRPGKNVQLTENEIKALCYKAREVFLSQPNLLELEAPIKVCGDMYALLSLPNSCFVVTGSTTICCGFSNMEDFRRKQTIFSLVTMSTEVSSRWKRFVFYWHTRY